MERTNNPRCAHLIAVARQVADRLVEPGLRAAVLFGSAVWGDADEASDLDIMILLDRPAGYREVTRVQVADLLGQPLPDGPRFADLDRLSAATFEGVVAKGGWGSRVVHSLALKDTDGYYARLRDQVSAEFRAPAARAARWQRQREQVAVERVALRQALDAGDTILAALHARLAVNEAAVALIDRNDDRMSITHFVESTARALDRYGQSRLFTAFLQALALDAPPGSVERGRRAYQLFADALKGWLDDPVLHEQLSHEDRAWSAFTYAAETYEEIDHKVTAFRQHGRLPALLYYLDGLLLAPVRLNLGKILWLRAHGSAARVTEREFHQALQAYPTLFAEWVTALRPDTPRDAIEQADGLAGQLLRVGGGGD